MPGLVAHDAGRGGFLARHLGPALLLLALLVAMEGTSMDATATGWFFDRVNGTFPLRYNAAFEIITHYWAKYVVILIAGAVLAAFLLSFAFTDLARHRRLLLFLFLAMTAAPAAVSALKAASPRHCPYDLVEYGGYARPTALLDAAPPGQAPGHCFPGGHASAGFSLMAFYFAGIALRNRTLARAGLWGGSAAGLAFGLARVAQGAHFLSHGLWSGLVCWVVMVALYRTLLAAPAGGS